MNDVNKELENVKSKYKKIIKIIVLLIILLIIFFSTKLIYTYNIISKILYTNYNVDLGNNYKLTVYKGKDREIESITYYKNNVKKTILNNDENHVGFCTNDKIYSIWKDSKVYECYDNPEKDNKKVSFINYYSLGINGPTSKDVWEFILYNNIKIQNEAEFKVIEMNPYKLWVDKETYLIKKEKLWEQVREYIVEKDVVTDEDIKLIDLSDYKEI